MLKLRMSGELIPTFPVHLHYAPFVYNAKLIGDILLTAMFSYMSSINQGIPRYVGCIIKIPHYFRRNYTFCIIG